MLHWHGWQAPPTSSGLPKKPDAHSSQRLPVRTNRHSGNCHHGSLVRSPIISKAIKTINGGALTGSCLKKQRLHLVTPWQLGAEHGWYHPAPQGMLLIPSVPVLSCPPFADHQSSFTILLEMRFMVALASPAQAALPCHLPGEATPQQHPTDAGAVVTSNSYEHTLLPERFNPTSHPSILPPSTYVSHATDTHDLQCDWILVTATGKLASTLGAVRARAGAAVVT